MGIVGGERAGDWVWMGFDRKALSLKFSNNTKA